MIVTNSFVFHISSTQVDLSPHIKQIVTVEQNIEILLNRTISRENMLSLILAYLSNIALKADL